MARRCGSSLSTGPSAVTETHKPVRNLWQGIVPALVLVVGFFLVPMLNVLWLSVAGPQGIAFDSYAEFFASQTMTSALGRSVMLAGLVVLCSTLIAWPLAYFLAFVVPGKQRTLWLFLLIAPFWTSFTVRAFSWQLVLADSGVLAYLLGLAAGHPVPTGLLYTFATSVFGLTLFGLMLMTLLLFSSMASIDRRLLEANRTLGGGSLSGFREIIVPLAAPGWVVGAVLTFIVAIGDYAVPTLLGGGFRPVLAQILVSVLKGTFDLRQAATMAAVLMTLVVIATLPLALVVRQTRFAN